MNINSKNYPILVVILCIVTRVPQLISPELFIDSDEAVLGLMTKHLLKGQEVSIFFWGQYYGLSIIEELFILPFFAVLGTSVMGVKLGMLLLWTVGVVLFYKMLEQLFSDKKNIALLFTLLLIAAPAWGVWSMKARGGYLTSFVLCNLSLLLAFNKKFIEKKYAFIVLGLLVYLSFESQPFFLSGVIPIIFYALWKKKNIYSILLFVGTITGLRFLFAYYKSDFHIYYRVHTETVTWENLYKQICRIPEFLYTSLTGNYHFSWSIKPDFFNAVFAMIFSALVFALFIVGVTQLKSIRKKILFYCSIVFIPATFFYSLYAYVTDYRYMLPVTAYCILAVGIYFMYNGFTQKMFRFTVVLIVIGCAGHLSLYSWQANRVSKEHIFKTIKLLDEHDIKYVYCADYTFNWDIMFHSDERIKARNFHFPNRYPKYDTLIDKAYENGLRTAVFGNKDRRFGLHFDNYIMDDVYYLSLNPPKEKLQPVFSFKPQ